MRVRIKRPACRAGVAFAGLILVILPSCGGEEPGRPKRYPATGKVIVDGKPEAGVQVRLHPVEGLDDVDAFHPAGVTDAEGVYRLGTFEQHDGAPAGRYKATLFWPDAPDPRSRPKDRFNGAYAKAETSHFDLAIAEGDNRLADLESTKSSDSVKPRLPDRRKTARDVGTGPDGPDSR
jgi:hypothetical protein